MRVVRTELAEAVQRGDVPLDGNLRGPFMEAFENGRIELAMIGAGESATLVQEIKPVADIIDETVAGFGRDRTPRRSAGATLSGAATMSPVSAYGHPHQAPGGGLELAADAVGGAFFPEPYVDPAQRLSRGDVPDQFDTVGQGDGETAQHDRHSSGHQAPPHRVTALAAEHLARSQVALGGGHHIGDPLVLATGGLAPQRRGQHGHVHLEPDQVVALVHGGVSTGDFGAQAYWAKHSAAYVVDARKDDADAPAQVAEHGAGSRFMHQTTSTCPAWSVGLRPPPG